METGYYRKKPIDWTEWEVDVFAPHLFQYNTAGCGASCLATITGFPPGFIHNTNRKNVNHWKDSFMVKFLKNHGFKVHHLTKCDVSNGDVNSTYTMNNITSRHVLMVSQLMNKNSASWSVVHDSMMYHNFQTVSFTGLSFVNSPTLTTYIVCHPSWRRENWIDKKYKKK